ncbi:hypothetical protein ACUOA5_52015 [Escherichia coli]
MFVRGTTEGINLVA